MELYFRFLFLLIIFNICEILSNNNYNVFNNNLFNNIDSKDITDDYDLLGKQLLYESYKFYNGSILFNTPRNHSSIQCTLCKYNKDTKQLIPFPNNEINDYAKSTQNCNNFISIVSFEIDEDNNIFALDEGNSQCSAKLHKLTLSDNSLEEQTFFDINKHVNKINEINIILNDFVLDKINNYAYIIYSNITSKDKNKYSFGIIGINLETKEIIDNKLQINFDENYSFSENLKKKIKKYIEDFEKKVISISLSCDGKTLFICPFADRKIYSINTEDIREDNKNLVINEAYKNDATSSLIISNLDNLYFTGIEKNVIYIAGQIDNDLSRFDYRSLEKIDITEKITDISYISKISLNNGTLYLTSKTFPKDGMFNSELLEKKIDEDNDYENSYMFKCSGLNYNYDWKSYFIWIIFAVIVIFILIFVFVEDYQDMDNNNINKKEK